MAIDPSIALDVKSPQSPLAMVGDYASLQQKLQSTQNMAAELPGIQADSAIKQRAASFNKWMNDNAQSFTGPALDSTGAEIPNAKPQFNINKFVEKAANAGYIPEAQSVAAHDLTNKGLTLSNFQTAATTKQTDAVTNGLSQAQGDAATRMAVDARGKAATIMDAFEKSNGIDPANVTPDQQALLDKQYTFLIKGTQDQWKQNGKQTLDVQSVFGQPNTNSKDQNNPVGTYTFNPHLNEAYRTATMTPEIQANLAGKAQGPEYSDPSSNVTKAIQQTMMPFAATDAEKQNIAKLTGAQLLAIPKYNAQWQNAQNPVDARTSAVSNGIQFSNKGDAYDLAARDLEAYKRTLSPEDQAAFSQSKFQAWFATHASAAMGGPQRDALIKANTSLGYVTGVDPTAKLDAYDAGALGSAMGNLRDLNYGFANRSLGVARAPTTAAAATSTAPPAGKPNAAPSKSSGNADVTAERAKANAAISKGADKAKVAARFKQSTGQDL